MRIDDAATWTPPRCSSPARGQRVKLAIFETGLNGITIVGSIVGTRADLREVFELHAAARRA